jgi:hypothetical protein
MTSCSWMTCELVNFMISYGGLVVNLIVWRQPI